MNRIEKTIIKNPDRLVIFPCGKMGLKIHNIISEEFGIDEVLFLDNYKANGKDILKMEEISEKMKNEYVFLMSFRNAGAFSIKKHLLRAGIDCERILDAYEILLDEDSKNFKSCMIPRELLGCKDYVSIWSELFRISLVGLNIGCGSDVSTSGENNVWEIIKNVTFFIRKEL